MGLPPLVAEGGRGIAAVLVATDGEAYGEGWDWDWRSDGSLELGKVPPPGILKDGVKVPSFFTKSLAVSLMLRFLNPVLVFAPAPPSSFGLEEFVLLFRGERRAFPVVTLFDRCIVVSSFSTVGGGTPSRPVVFDVPGFTVVVVLVVVVAVVVVVAGKGTEGDFFIPAERGFGVFELKDADK